MLRRRSDSSGVGGAGGDRGGVFDRRFTFAIPFETSSPVLATRPVVVALSWSVFAFVRAEKRDQASGMCEGRSSREKTRVLGQIQFVNPLRRCAAP